MESNDISHRYNCTNKGRVMACFEEFLCDRRYSTMFVHYVHNILAEEELEFWLDVELYKLDDVRYAGVRRKGSERG